MVISDDETDRKIIIRNIRRVWRTGRLTTARAVMKIVTIGQVRQTGRYTAAGHVANLCRDGAEEEH